MYNIRPFISVRCAHLSSQYSWLGNVCGGQPGWGEAGQAGVLPCWLSLTLGGGGMVTPLL